jgi:hypothetical protein
MMTKEADDARKGVIPRLADELRLLSTMVNAFTTAVSKGDTKVQNGALRSTTMPSLILLKELWPCLNHIATKYASHQQVSSAGFARIILIQF